MLVSTCLLRGAEASGSRIEIYDRYTLHQCTDPNGTQVYKDPTAIADKNQYFDEVEIEGIAVITNHKCLDRR